MKHVFSLPRGALAGLAALLALGLGGAVTPPVTVPATAQAACLGGDQLRQAVQSGAVLPLGALADRLPGRIVRADLCQEGGGLVYRVAVLSGQNVSVWVIDARSGAVLSR